MSTDLRFGSQSVKEERSAARIFLDVYVKHGKFETRPPIMLVSMNNPPYPVYFHECL